MTLSMHYIAFSRDKLARQLRSTTFTYYEFEKRYKDINSSLFIYQVAKSALSTLSAAFQSLFTKGFNRAIEHFKVTSTSIRCAVSPKEQCYQAKRKALNQFLFRLLKGKDPQKSSLRQVRNQTRFQSWKEQKKTMEGCASSVLCEVFFHEGEGAFLQYLQKVEKTALASEEKDLCSSEAYVDFLKPFLRNQHVSPRLSRVRELLLNHRKSILASVHKIRVRKLLTLSDEEVQNRFSKETAIILSRAVTQERVCKEQLTNQAFFSLYKLLDDNCKNLVADSFLNQSRNKLPKPLIDSFFTDEHGKKALIAVTAQFSSVANLRSRSLFDGSASSLLPLSYYQFEIFSKGFCENILARIHHFTPAEKLAFFDAAKKLNEYEVYYSRECESSQLHFQNLRVELLHLAICEDPLYVVSDECQKLLLNEDSTRDPSLTWIRSVFLQEGVFVSCFASSMLALLNVLLLKGGEQEFQKCLTLFSQAQYRLSHISPYFKKLADSFLKLVDLWFQQDPELQKRTLFEMITLTPLDLNFPEADYLNLPKVREAHERLLNEITCNYIDEEGFAAQFQDQIDTALSSHVKVLPVADRDCADRCFSYLFEYLEYAKEFHLQKVQSACLAKAFSSDDFLGFLLNVFKEQQASFDSKVSAMTEATSQGTLLELFQLEDLEQKDPGETTVFAKKYTLRSALFLLKRIFSIKNELKGTDLSSSLKVFLAENKKELAQLFYEDHLSLFTKERIDEFKKMSKGLEAI